MTRHALSILLIASLAVAVPAQLKPAPKVGDKAPYKIKYTMDIQGMDVTVSLATTVEVTKVDENEVARAATSKDLKVVLGGQDLEPTPEIAPMKVVIGKDGAIKTFSGGMEGVDALRMFLTTHFFAPTAELKEGASTKSTFDKKGDFPKSTVEVAFVGAEDLNGEKALKFTQKFKEDGELGFSCDTTVWALEDGTVLKIEGAFKNLPIPAAGSEASGKITMERQKA
ncbi:MAG: hypothetical protein KIS66_06400 [Fimbriimonadaceae bacterium]|nr:hypothetical protein [Fimbriimonadaceae bacterium]